MYRGDGKRDFVETRKDEETFFFFPLFSLFFFPPLPPEIGHRHATVADASEDLGEKEIPLFFFFLSAAPDGHRNAINSKAEVKDNRSLNNKKVFFFSPSLPLLPFLRLLGTIPIREANG